MHGHAERGRVITRAHYAAWTIAALSGGALACETAPACAGPVPVAALQSPRTKVAPRVEHFRHNGNDCYIYQTYAIACVRAEAGQ